MKNKKELQDEFDSLFGNRFSGAVGNNNYENLRDAIIGWSISIPIEPPVKPDACGKNIAGKYFLIGVGVGSNHKDIDKYRIEGLSSPPSIFNKIWDYEENKSKHSV